MSRLRSQINSITLESNQPELAHSQGRHSPQPAYAPTPQQPTAQPQHNLKHIQDALNAIAGKVDNLSQRNSQAKDQQDNRLQHAANEAQPEYLHQMHAELQNLKSSLLKISNKPNQPVDLSKITQSIETGYADIAGRLDQFFQNNSGAVAEQNYDLHFNTLQNRVEEISNAVASLHNAPPSATDSDALHRLEARILNVSNAVDQLLQVETVEAPVAAVELSPAVFEPVTLQIERLSHKIDNLPTIESLGNNILSDFEGVTQRLDTLQSDFNMLTSHLAQTAEASQANDEDAVLTVVEDRIAELSHKIDQISHAPASAGGENVDSQELIEVLRDLVSKVDHLQSTPVQAASAEPLDMTSFEMQLASISDRLGAVSGMDTGFGNANLQPINDRLDNIESQIAASRDIVIDMASQAAEKAAVATNDGQLENAQFNEITGALSSIAQRLSSIEEKSYSAPAPIYDTPSNAAYQQGGEMLSEVMPSEVMPSEVMTEEPLLQSDVAEDPVNYGQISDAPSMDSSLDVGTLEQESIEADAVNVEAVEDIPLEPGSGMPDIEALVRRATQRKKDSNAQSDGQSEETSSDLVAAARRAAQAASMDLQNAAMESDAQTAKKSRFPRLPKLGGKAKKVKAESLNVENGSLESEPKSAKSAFSSGKTKQLMMASVAVLALGFAAYTVVPKFLGKGSKSAQIEVAAPSDTMSSGTMQSNVLGDSQIETPTEIEELSKPTDLAARDMMSPQGTAPLSGSGFDAIDETVNTEIVDTDINAVANIDTNVENSQPVDQTKVIQTAGPTPPQEVGNDALVQAATNGNLNAIFEVGRRYSDGAGVKRSFENAAKWYEIAASKGHALSQYRIGNFYEKGHGVKADPEKASIWYEQAAKQGNALAMHNLAVLNAQGVIGTEPNMERAVELFTKAADLGVKDSQVNLGIMFTQGMGAEKNLEKAYKWFAIANRAGDQDAGKKRDIVGNAMRPEQLKQARANAESWKPAQVIIAANTAPSDPAWSSTGDLKQVSKKDVIRKTQSLLTRAGFDPGPADGLFGLKTRDAIVSFQKRTGMKTNGEISPELLRALAKVSA